LTNALPFEAVSILSIPRPTGYPERRKNPSTS
jgi:hypothetical protein